MYEPSIGDIIPDPPGPPMTRGTLLCSTGLLTLSLPHSLHSSSLSSQSWLLSGSPGAQIQTRQGINILFRKTAGAQMDLTWISFYKIVLYRNEIMRLQYCVSLRPRTHSLTHHSTNWPQWWLSPRSAISWWTADAQNITGGGSSHLEIEQLTECGLWSWSLYPVSPGYARGCSKITWSSTFPFMEYLIYPSLPISIRCLTDCHLFPLIFAFPRPTVCN